MWDSTTHQSLFSVNGHPAAIAPDGTLIAAAADRSVGLWDAASGQRKFTLAGHTGAVTTMAFSPDGKTLTTGSKDKSVILWDAATGKKQTALLGHSKQVYKVLFSPDGARLATGGEDYQIILWDVSTGTRLGTYSTGNGYLFLGVFSPDGKILVCMDSTEHMLRLLDSATGSLVDSIDVAPVTVEDPVFSPDGSVLATYSGFYGADFVILDPESNFHPPKDGITGPGASFSTDGAFGAGSDLLTIVVWDTSTGKRMHEFQGHTGEILKMAFSPDGRTLASVSQDGTILLWDLAAALGR